MDLLLFSLLNLSDVRRPACSPSQPATCEPFERLALTIALLCLVFFPTFLFCVLRALSRPGGLLPHLAELGAGLRAGSRSFLGTRYHLMFLLRRLGLVAVLVFLRESGLLQLLLSMLLSVLELLLIAHTRPYRLAQDNVVSMVNESVLLFEYFLLGVTHHLSPDSALSPEALAWLIVGVVILSNLGNIVVLTVLRAIACCS